MEKEDGKAKGRRGAEEEDSEEAPDRGGAPAPNDDTSRVTQGQLSAVKSTAFKLLQLQAQVVTPLSNELDGADGLVNVSRFLEEVSKLAEAQGTERDPGVAPSRDLDLLAKARGQGTILCALIKSKLPEAARQIVESGQIEDADGVPRLSRIADVLRKRFVTPAGIALAFESINEPMKAGESPLDVLARLQRLSKLCGLKLNDDALLGLLKKAVGHDLVRAAASAVGLEAKVAAMQEAWWPETKRKHVAAVDGKQKAASTREPAATVAAVGRPAQADRSGLRCYLCDKPGHRALQCPDAICARCGAKGHIAGSCPNKGEQYAQRVVSGAGRRRDAKGTRGSAAGGNPRPAAAARATVDATIGAVRGVPAAAAGGALRPDSTGNAGPPTDGRLVMEVVFGGRAFKALCDPGALISVISEAAIEGAEVAWVTSEWRSVSGPFGGTAVVRGAVMGRLEAGRAALADAEAVVVGNPMPYEMIVGADMLRPLGVMGALRKRLVKLGVAVTYVAGGGDVAAMTAERHARQHPERYEPPEAFDELDLSHLDDLPEEQARLRALLKEYRESFLKDGEMPEAANVPAAHLFVTGPPRVAAARPWGPEHKAKLARHEVAFKEAGLAYDVKSSQWRSEPLLVPKKDGSDRYTVDHKLANTSLAANAYPMPILEEEFDKLEGGDVYSDYDLAFGYYQIPLDKESREVATVRSTTGLMQFGRLTMGFAPSPGLFNEALQSSAIKDLPDDIRAGTAQFVDDLAHASRGSTRAEAVRAEIGAIRATLAAAAKYGWTFRLRKCRFCVTKIVWCGCELSKAGRAVEPDRVRAMVQFGRVETKADARRFAGLVNRLRNCVPRLDYLLRPIYLAAGRKGGKLDAGTLEPHVERLKKVAAETIYRHAPRRDRPLTLTVDASGEGLGAELTQDNKLVAVYSRALRGAEYNYAPFDLEWLGIMFGLESVEYYTRGRQEPILVISDHEPLDGLELRAVEDRSGRRARWVERLQRFNFQMRWKTGEVMAGADALSHSPAFRAAKARAREEAGAAVAKAIGGAPQGGEVAAIVAVEPEQKDGAWWRGRQLKDPELKDIIDFIEDKTNNFKAKKMIKLAALAEHFALGDGGELRHTWLRQERAAGSRRGVRQGEAADQVVIPAGPLRRQAFDIRHAIEAGHERFDKTMPRMLADVWWKGMWTDVRKWCDGCEVCEKNSSIKDGAGLLDPTTAAKFKGRRVMYMDAAGPLPETIGGKKYVVLWVDLQDGWVDVEAVKDLSTESTVKAFRDRVLPVSGVPDVFVHDQGSNYVSALAAAVYADLGVESHQTAPFNPQANGKAEAHIKMIKKAMIRLSEQFNVEWDEVLQMAAAAIRSDEAHAPGRISPFELRAGRRMKLPSAFALPAQPTASLVMEEMRRRWLAVSRLRDEAAAEMKERFDVGRHEADFEAGQKVWIKKNDRENGLDSKRIGPFEIAEVLSPLNVRIKEAVGGPQLGQRSDVVNVKQLAAYKGDKVPGAQEWVVRDVIGHKGKGKGRKYHVLWEDGADTWEPRAALVDNDNGEETPVGPLLRYWERNPRLSRSY